MLSVTLHDVSASGKQLMSTVSGRGPHRVLRGNLAIAGLPGVVYAPESGRDLPAVAFGHGWVTGPGHYSGLLEHLASWGIVAAAPNTERGWLPSHLGLADDLRTTLDICTRVKLGDGTVTVHPERLALAGHGMGAGTAVLAARRHRVGAVAALFPAPTAPASEAAAPDIDVPALILAAPEELASLTGNARALAAAWGGPAILRTVDKATRNGLVEGRRLLAAFGADKHQYRTTRLTRGLLTGFVLAVLAKEKIYAPFAAPDTPIRHAPLVDPTEIDESTDNPKPSPREIARVVRSLRK